MGQRPRTVDEYGRVYCPVCMIWKHLTEYHQNKRTKLGISSACKACHNDKQVKYNAADKARRAREREAAIKLRQDLEVVEDLPGTRLTRPPTVYEPTDEELEALIWRGPTVTDQDAKQS